MYCLFIHLFVCIFINLLIHVSIIHLFILSLRTSLLGSPSQHLSAAILAKGVLIADPPVFASGPARAL